MDVIYKLINGIDYLDKDSLYQSALKAAVKAAATDPNPESNSILNSVADSALYLIDIPDECVQKSFSYMFQYLARTGVIPLGLLRGTMSNMSIGPKCNTMPYVCTNPDRDTEVFVCDRVFVLSPSPIASKLHVKVTVCLIKQTLQDQNLLCLHIFI